MGLARVGLLPPLEDPRAADELPLEAPLDLEEVPDDLEEVAASLGGRATLGRSCGGGGLALSCS